MDSADLKARTKALAVKVVGFVENLERTNSVDIIGKQLVRSATSVAANYRAACRSRSKADFVNKLGIVEEEADETVFWFELLLDCRKAEQEEVGPMIDEAGQLLRIISASRITARANASKKQEDAQSFNRQSEIDNRQFH
jgi:four helix bundle protein